MGNQRLSLYHVEWQVLRIQLLGNWTTEKSMHANIHKLIAYLEQRDDTCTIEQMVTKYYQVINLLDAVRMGFSGMGLIGSDLDKEFCAWKESFSQGYWALRKAHPGVKFIVPTEEDVLTDCTTIGASWTLAIHENLLKRYAFALRKAKNDHDKVRTNRPELLWMINLTDQALKGM